ncbi:outer membrane protein assembly factor BamB family protein [Leptospira kanakyensis]|uniref:outer membrane protein assembly factor BamB family protein n=1 Tax=Leptospira kanakyensis TaxID=2484968 RepID=UPI00223CECAC|nr:PQQ-binding-like beta-propeller repeat protein [Leptospira kanakyensis]MCW7483280.1 PQQ-binding-like beta-propeller repeat protein [Leptospira kanakyensis]
MKPTKLLEYKFSGKRDITSRKPLVIDDKLIILFNYNIDGFPHNEVICFNIHNFTILWKYEDSFVGNNILKTPNNNVLICYMDGKLIEINHKNGSPVEKFDLGMKRNGQTSNLYKNKIIISGIQGTEETICFDFDKRQVLWRVYNQGHSYIPFIYEDKVYQCAEDKIVCRDLNSGSTIWKSSEKGYYNFHPNNFQSNIVVGGHGIIKFYNPINGKLLLQINTENKETIYRIISDENSIYFGDTSGIFYAYKITEAKNFLGTRTLKADLQWKFSSQGAIQSIPEILDEKIIFINDDKKLICLDKKNGNLHWQININGEAGISGLTFFENTIITSVSKGHIFKITESNK